MTDLSSLGHAFTFTGPMSSLLLGGLMVKNKMFLAHAFMCTRGFYKFLSELSTCFKNILLEFGGRQVSLHRRKDPFIARLLLTSVSKFCEDRA